MPTLTKDTTVRELLCTYPQTFLILLRHGMCADCDAAPPPISLDRFAMKHCNGDVTGLIREIEESLRSA